MEDHICLSLFGLLLQNYHRLGALNNKRLPCKVLEAESLRGRCQEIQVLGEGPLSGLQMAAFLLHPHMALRDKLSRISSYKDTSPIHGGFTAMT